jgi:hypothetical protein
LIKKNLKLEWNDIKFENKVKTKKKIAMTQYIIIVKTRSTSILCILCVFSSIVIGSKKQKKKNQNKKNKIKCQPNPLTCELHIFSNWTLHL